MKKIIFFQLLYRSVITPLIGFTLCAIDLSQNVIYLQFMTEFLNYSGINDWNHAGFKSVGNNLKFIEKRRDN